MYYLPEKIEEIISNLNKFPEQEDEIFYLNIQDRKYIISALQETYKVWRQ